jgi:hypothetical protein
VSLENEPERRFRGWEGLEVSKGIAAMHASYQFT